MGGLGSGRPRKNPGSWLVDECDAIDVCDLGHSSCTRQRWRSDAKGHWSDVVLQGDDSSKQFGMRSDTQRIDLISTVAGRTGVRWWYQCPGCASRRRKLYRPPGRWRFRCRSCYGLAYRTSREHDTRVDQLAEIPAYMSALLDAHMERLSIDNAAATMLVAVRCLQACQRKIRTQEH